MLKTILGRLRNKATRADDILVDLQTQRGELSAVRRYQEQSQAELRGDLAGIQARLGSELHTLNQTVAALAADSKVRANLESRLDEYSATLEEATATLSRIDASFEEAHPTLSRIDTTLEEANAKLTRIERSFQPDRLSEAAPNAPTRNLHQRIRIHFFFQFPEVWTTWESVWNACVRSPRIAADIVLLPFIHGSASGDPLRARRFLADTGLPFIDISAYRLREEQPDVVILQNPYDSTRPPELSTDRLLSLRVKIAYIPYGLDVGGGVDNLRWQFDLEVQRRAWRVFVRSQQHRQLYGLHCQSGNRHVVVTGHPKIDHIVAHCAPSGSGRARLRKINQKNILWCPHFTLERGGWSTFMKLFNPILEFFETKPEDLTLTVRPHPLFFGRLNELDGGSSVTEYELRQRLHQPPHITLDESEQYASSFLMSDALMADAGSFLLEYLPTEKPILYLDNADGPGLNESGGFVTAYYQTSDYSGVQNFFEMIRRGEDPKREDRISQIHFLLYRLDGTVGAQIVEHIVAALTTGATGAPCDRNSTGQGEQE